MILLIQLHEWCQFLVACGKVQSLESPTLTSGRHTTLCEDDLKLLEAMYMTVNSKFALLSGEYSKALTRATNARKKSIFPSKPDWTPPPPLRSKDSAELLMGPSADVVLHDRVSNIDPNTHRVISFTSSTCLKASSRHSASFVHLLKGRSLYLAQIKFLFTHVFVGESCDMAMLQVFKNPIKDVETMLYYIDNVQQDSNTNIYHSTNVDPSSETMQMVIPVKELSVPHVVAYDNHKLWYISFNDETVNH